MPPPRRPWDIDWNTEEPEDQGEVVDDFDDYPDAQASEFCFFREPEHEYTAVCITPISHLLRTGYLYDQTGPVGDLLPPDLELYELMEGVWESERPWAAIREGLLRAGFVEARPEWLAPLRARMGALNEPDSEPPPGWPAYDAAQPGRGMPAAHIETLTGNRARPWLGPTEPEPEPEPVRPAKNAWARLLDDEDDETV